MLASNDGKAPMLTTAHAPRIPMAPAALARHDAVCFDHAGAAGHDSTTKASVARAIAELLELPFAERARDARAPYRVPCETLVGLAAAARTGVRGPEDLFGGVVPQAFMATKLITHPLPDACVAAPAGWPALLGAQLHGVVLPGYSAFSSSDALAAGEHLLRDGPVRLKAGDGVGGAGQAVVACGTELARWIGALDPAALARDGCVLECNLEQVVTYSVGAVSVGRWRAAYCGQQTTTRNRAGEEVYGGSRLVVARGGFDELLALDLPLASRAAVLQAMQYDALTRRACRGMFASRVNYDVAQGVDAQGRLRSGVLEQSWRIGGASGAEVAALLAFKADPALHCVVASTHEVHADHAVVPAGARLHFDGVDAQQGRLLKYAQVHRHGHA